MATVTIPSLMRDLTGGQAIVVVSGKTVREVIDALDTAYPGIKARLCPGERLDPSLVISVDGKVTRLGLRQPICEDSEILFLPAVAGG